MATLQAGPEAKAAQVALAEKLMAGSKFREVLAATQALASMSQQTWAGTAETVEMLEKAETLQEAQALAVAP